MTETRHQDRIASALSLACGVHHGQRDRAGKSYILHPIHVMLRAERLVLASAWKDDEELRIEVMIAAILHDTDEDFRGDLGQRVRMRQHVRETFGDRVADAVEALTRKRNESYNEFTNRCCNNLIATFVKIADCDHNSDLSRLKSPRDEDLRRAMKYMAAHRKLRSALRRHRRELINNV